MRKIHPASIRDAFIWAVAIVATAIMLRGTEQGGMVVVILGGAAGASVLIVGSALRKT